MLTWQRLLPRAWALKLEFIEINWDNKIMELDSKGVDCCLERHDPDR